MKLNVCFQVSFVGNVSQLILPSTKHPIKRGGILLLRYVTIPITYELCYLGIRVAKMYLSLGLQDVTAIYNLFAHQ